MEQIVRHKIEKNQKIGSGMHIMKQCFGFVILFLVFTASSAMAQTSEQIREAQALLTETGRDPGPVDGLWGRRTEAALKDFLKAQGQTFDGVLSENELALLKDRNGGPGPISDAFSYAHRLAYLKRDPIFAQRACSLASKPDIPFLGTVSMKGSGPRLSNRCGGEECAQTLDEIGKVYYAALKNTTSCFLQDGEACANVVDTLERYAVEGGIVYRGSRSRKSQEFFDLSLELAIALRPLIGGYYFAKSQGLVTEEQIEVIEPWIQETVLFWGRASHDGQHNHSTNKANLNAVAGLATGEREFIEIALDRYKIEINGMRRDGSFPSEAERGSAAVSYIGLQISHLLNLAEYLAMGGTDVFDYDASGKNIHQAMSFWLDTLEDWDIIFDYAKANVAAPTNDHTQQIFVSPDLIFGAFGMYSARYPDHPNVARINELHLDPRTCATLRHREGNRTLYGLCTSPDTQISLKQVMAGATGAADRGMVPNTCMFGEPVKSEPAFQSREVFAEAKYEEGKFQRQELVLFGNSVGEDSVDDIVFNVFLDYATDTNEAEAIEFVRFFFPVSGLSDAQSREADYSSCREIVVKEENGEKVLGLALIGDTSENACVLQKMGQNDRAFFASLQQDIGDILAKGMGDGAPKLRAVFGVPEPIEALRPSLLADRVGVTQTSSEDVWDAYVVMISGLRLAGSDIPRFARLELLADYKSTRKSPKNMNFLRMWFMRRSLSDSQSREADYSDCRNIVYRERNGDQQIAVAFFGDTSENSCILRKMGPNDRALYTSLLSDLQGLINSTGADGVAVHLENALAANLSR